LEKEYEKDEKSICGGVNVSVEKKNLLMLIV
jgi:hypothetical protein